MISLPLASELEEYYVCLQEYHWRKEQYEDLMLNFLYRAIGYGY